MKVLVAGATGAVGRPLLPLLLARGHEVVGMTRSPDKAKLLREAGVEPIVADGLDRHYIYAQEGLDEPGARGPHALGERSTQQRDGKKSERIQ